MTYERKATFPLAVQWACPGQFHRSRALLVIGVLLIPAVLGRGAWAMQAQPDWWEEISPAGSVSVTASHVSRSKAQEYLERLGLVAGAVGDPEVSVYGSGPFHGVQDASADWAAKRLELNGKFAVRQSTDVLGQAMTVTSVISADGLLTTDDRGRYRIEAYREFPAATCRSTRERFGCDGVELFDVARDEYGTIVEFVRDGQGLPSGVRFGEILLLRYSFTPPLPERPRMGRLSDRWRPPSSWELIDLRTGEIVVDAVDAAKVASERQVLSVFFRGIGEVLRFEDGQAFAVAHGARQAPHALLPLDTTSDVWRSVYASGDMSRQYRFRVDYTDDLLRVEIGAGGLGRSIVVEAPRSRDSEAPVSFVHPGADMLTDAIHSGVRLRITEPLDAWLHSTFEKESLPIVLWPFHNRGIQMESGVIREAAASSVESHFQFGPADGCKEQDEGIVCTGGASEVIGEESPYPW